MRFWRGRNRPPDPDVLAGPLAHYRGSFMEGFTLAGCGAFEAWFTIQREHFRRLAVEGYARLAAIRLAQERRE